MGEVFYGLTDEPDEGVLPGHDDEQYSVSIVENRGEIWLTVREYKNADTKPYSVNISSQSDSIRDAITNARRRTTLE